MPPSPKRARRVDAVESRQLWSWVTTTGHVNRFEIAYSPIAAAGSRQHKAAESLVKWNGGLARRLQAVAPQSLALTFDSRPGYERNCDRRLRRVLPLLLPPGVHDDLYPFQRNGVAWLLQNRKAILADDMGLGKTIQVIAAIRRLYRYGRIESCLIIAPRTLIANWLTETDKWAPELIARQLEFTNRTFTPAHWRGAVARAHVLLASYEDLRGLWDDLEGEPPDLLVADEAHRLRKSESLAHQAMRRVAAPRMWGLTGTPVERDAQDLACLLSLLEPRRFAIDDHRHGIDALRVRVRPYLLRRTKESVLPELPEATEHIETVSLHPAQRDAYNTALSSIGRRSEEGYLALFNRLRSICDIDPETGESAKLDRAVELTESAMADGCKTVVFSYMLDPLRHLQSRLVTAHGNIAAMLTGEQSLDQRERSVARFKTDRDCWALLASTRVASEGLTLTEASRVIFVNRWWNPSTNSQAVDRVVRIGQTKPVIVRYLTCTDTVEDRLQPLLDRKEMTFDQLIDALQHRPEAVRELLTT